MGFNSTIQQKQKICLSCGKPCFWFSRKRCKSCAAREDAKPIARMSEKKKAVVAEEKVGGGAELQRWFEERRKELTGTCANCGGKSCKNSDQYYKFSVAHLLPKSIFKSVATHPKNFLELCFWEKSCHTNFDQGILDMTEMNCWDEIVQKFQLMYPHIAKKERRRIPEVLLQYIGTDF